MFGVCAIEYFEEFANGESVSGSVVLAVLAVLAVSGLFVHLEFSPARHITS
jgi:hypothetical protein